MIFDLRAKTILNLKKNEVYLLNLEMKSKINHAIEAEAGSENENAERIRKMELVLSKAMEYADKLIHHRS